MKEENLSSQFCPLSAKNSRSQEAENSRSRPRDGAEFTLLEFLNSWLLEFKSFPKALMIELLQEMQEIFIVNRLSDNRVQAIDSLIVGGVVERNTTLA